MSEHPISRFPVPTSTSCPHDVRERIEAVAEQSGFVPNVFLVLAHRPDEFRAFFAYHDALMERPSGLSKGEKELIVVATSAANDCQYCVVAHGAIARIRMKDPLIADQVAVNYRKADLTDRQKAMLAFALKVATRSGEVVDADLDERPGPRLDRRRHLGHRRHRRLLRPVQPHGEPDDMRPNDEFYALGPLTALPRAARCAASGRGVLAQDPSASSRCTHLEPVLHVLDRHAGVGPAGEAALEVGDVRGSPCPSWSWRSAPSGRRRRSTGCSAGPG